MVPAHALSLLLTSRALWEKPKARAGTIFAPSGVEQPFNPKSMQTRSTPSGAVQVPQCPHVCMTSAILSAAGMENMSTFFI